MSVITHHLGLRRHLLPLARYLRREGIGTDDLPFDDTKVHDELDVMFKLDYSLCISAEEAGEQ